MQNSNLVASLQNIVYPFDKISSGVENFLELIQDERFIFIGEATHGTYEFYKFRSELTQRLIKKKGFRVVLIEWDWPDVYEVNRHVLGEDDGENLLKVMGHFQRFPSWMWRNSVVFEFLSWLSSYNKETPLQRKIRFYGMDLYSLYTSFKIILKTLELIDPKSAEKSRECYHCFEPMLLDPQEYGYAVNVGLKKSCESFVISQFLEFHEKLCHALQSTDPETQEEFFSLFQNALLIKNAEAYYRALYSREISSWNMRDAHMFHTLCNLDAYLSHKDHEKPKIVVWAHNSHLGDARATDCSRRGEINIGQLATEAYGTEVFKIGFSTYTGDVAAASQWGGPLEVKEVIPALEESYEFLFHEVKYPNFLINLKEAKNSLRFLEPPRLQRAIGVIYRPETERQSHYFQASLLNQFEALVHLNVTHAVTPLP